MDVRPASGAMEAKLTTSFCQEIGARVSCGSAPHFARPGRTCAHPRVIRNHHDPSQKSQGRHACALVTILFALSIVGARAQSPGPYIDLHDFGGVAINANGASGPDGSYPNCSVTFDSAGNMYGTTADGGANSLGRGVGGGTVWEITTSGAYKDLHDFGGTVTNADGASGPDGYYSHADIIFDSAGNMYGTTTQGGPDAVPSESNYGGTVWEINAAGTYKDLHDFGGTVTNADGKSGPDGNEPTAGETFDGAGNLCGTASQGGPNGAVGAGGDGMVWEITTSLQPDQGYWVFAYSATDVEASE
jgi:hypothetical protein